MWKSGNPALSGNFLQVNRSTYDRSQAMSVEGTANKTLLLLLLTTISAGWMWTNPQFGGLVVVGAVGGLIVALVTMFKKEWSGITAPVYALLEGLVLGGISVVMEAMYPGIAIQAISLTMGTLLMMLVSYKAGYIRATDKFRSGIIMATGGIALVYLASMLLGFFGVRLPFIYEGGVIGILFSLFVVVIASLNLILDFDLIENLADSGAPKYMEWYGAFSLMVTLIWLYLEILRLLAKMRER